MPRRLESAHSYIGQELADSIYQSSQNQIHSKHQSLAGRPTEPPQFSSQLNPIKQAEAAANTHFERQPLPTGSRHEHTSSLNQTNTPASNSQRSRSEVDKVGTIETPRYATDYSLHETNSTAAGLHAKSPGDLKGPSSVPSPKVQVNPHRLLNTAPSHSMSSDETLVRNGSLVAGDVYRGPPSRPAPSSSGTTADHDAGSSSPRFTYYIIRSRFPRISKQRWDTNGLSKKEVDVVFHDVGIMVANPEIENMAFRLIAHEEHLEDFEWVIRRGDLMAFKDMWGDFRKADKAACRNNKSQQFLIEVEPEPGKGVSAEKEHRADDDGLDFDM